MGRLLFNIQPLLQAISAGACILTPNQRLKNKILAAYHQQQPDSLAYWQAPAIYSYNEWLEESYQSALDKNLLSTGSALISDQAAQQLWLSIISESPLGAELINPLRLASDAHNAYQTLLRWHIAPEALPELCLQQGWHYDSPFAIWAADFDAKLTALKLCTAEQLQLQLAVLFQTEQLPRYSELLLIGFDDIHPLQQDLLRHACETLSAHAANDLTQLPQSCCTVSYRNAQDEARAAALWSADVLLQQPDATVGIIAPNLGQVRQTLEQVFTEVFEPHFPLPDSARYTLPFNFSAGVPLGSTALINDTLALLQLNHKSMPQEKLQKLFNSPFWMGGEDQAIAQPILSKVRRQTHPDIRIARLRQWAHELGQTETEGEEANPWQLLDQGLQDTESMRRQFGQQHLPSTWLELFERQLRRLGWPGQRRLDSNEYQQLNQWYQLLDQFCQLDNLQQHVSCQRALELLNQAVGQTHFQAQTPESPIQILGILEGAGLSFTHVWILGMSQHQWPPSPSPNPLLPIPLQRQQHMPHADADRELHYARSILQNYLHGCHYLVASYASFDEDRPQQPSPLLDALPHTTTPMQPPLPDSALPVSPWQRYQQKVANTQSLQWVNIATAPAVSATERERLSGGSQIFRHQALLPQAAFLIHRLRSEENIAQSLGFSPIERGQILHDALSVLWAQWHDQATLASLDAEALDTALTTALHHEIQRYQRRDPDIYGEHYAQLELQRQKRLLKQWLQLELERPDFTVVANEETLSASVGGLPVRLRLDRMDRLANGELVVIDYKTGMPSPKHWGGDRPQEPQLPLYCLCYNSDIHAVVFAQINVKEIAIKGLGGLSTPLPGVTAAADNDWQLPSTWEEIKTHWQDRLTQLAQEFLNGDVSLELADRQAARFYEHLAPLLRSAEQDEIASHYRPSKPPLAAATPGAHSEPGEPS